ncbi:fumarate reductase subunit FrdD [Bradyrhizobium ontarionense]|uniref:Fumarate reductase subunit FrdD n=1 Tax=Bradyrhizobium ontarionense TaxID=2898149 RepID=A0ABY3R7A5_9BRAD|nr:fumarate reductase subunit FrdD [Bradyrhizobium sp. A19]UFZ03203.1 fumarate reductase subunit FrdD [Bradyrhizobium sp. A19]
MSVPKDSPLPKRTIAPLFWLLFGAGGMLSALFGPALILITGIMIPHGWGVPERLGSYDTVLAFARNPLGKLVLLALIALLFWHAAERLFLTLHDMRVGTVTVLRWLTYGVAFVLTIVTAVVLLMVGF